MADIESDISLFNEILGKLSELDLVISDPKTQCLIENIEKVISKKPSNGEKSPFQYKCIKNKYITSMSLTDNEVSMKTEIVATEPEKDRGGLRQNCETYSFISSLSTRY